MKVKEKLITEEENRASVLRGKSPADAPINTIILVQDWVHEMLQHPEIDDELERDLIDAHNALIKLRRL